MEHYFCLLEPGLLEELQIRVEAAEQKFKAAELDDHLSEFEVARQRQVNILLKWKNNYGHHSLCMILCNILYF